MTKELLQYATGTSVFEKAQNVQISKEENKTASEICNRKKW